MHCGRSYTRHDSIEEMRQNMEIGVQKTDARLERRPNLNTGWHASGKMPLDESGLHGVAPTLGVRRHE